MDFKKTSTRRPSWESCSGRPGPRPGRTSRSSCQNFAKRGLPASATSSVRRTTSFECALIIETRSFKSSTIYLCHAWTVFRKFIDIVWRSLTRWLVFWHKIWPFATLNICPKPYKICQSKFNKLPNSKWTFPKYQSFITLGQRGEISPNLDTLIVNNLVFWSRQMNKCEPLQITNIFQQQQNPLIFTWLTTSIQRILT